MLLEAPVMIGSRSSYSLMAAMMKYQGKVIQPRTVHFFEGYLPPKSSDKQWVLPTEFIMSMDVGKMSIPELVQWSETH